MGQYFAAVNPDREEYVSLESGAKIFERLTNAEAMTKLGLLLVDNDDESFDFYGRWAGDDVRLVGDYADGNLYSRPDPTVTVAPLTDPSKVRYDSDTTTASDPESITEPRRYERHGSPIPVLKGSWNNIRCDHKTPGSDHPDADLTPGTFVRMRASQYDDLDDDTYGVVMSITNDWTDVTAGIEREAQLVSDETDPQQTHLQPFTVL